MLYRSHGSTISGCHVVLSPGRRAAKLAAKQQRKLKAAGTFVRIEK